MLDKDKEIERIEKFKNTPNYILEYFAPMVGFPEYRVEIIRRKSLGIIIDKKIKE